MSCNAAEWCGTVVERVMQDYSTYCREEIKFTCADFSISSISSVTLTYMWSKGVRACSIHVTRVISCALVNICKIINIKKIVIKEKLLGISLECLPCGSRREHFTLPLIRFFSVSTSSNPLFCSVSLFIKFPFPSLDFLPLNVYRIQWCHYRHCLQANIHLFFRQGMLVIQVFQRW